MVWNEFNRANRNANSLQEFSADPINFFGAKEVKAGAFGLSRGFYKLAGKSEVAKKALISLDAMRSLAGESKLAKSIGWLNKPILSKEAQWLEDNKDLITKQKTLGSELRDITDIWRTTKNEEAIKFADKIRNLSPTESNLFQQFVTDILPRSEKFGTDTLKQFHSWDSLNLPRGFGKAEMRKIEDLAREWKRIGDKLYSGQLDYFSSIYGGADQIPRKLRAYRRGYVPRVVVRDAEKSGISKFIKNKAGSTWWTKGKKDFSLQNTEDLANSLQKRVSSQLWQMNPEASWLRDNAGKYIDDLEMTTRELQARRFRDFELNKASKIPQVIKAPTNVWKKAVLKYRPAWYINNMAWNIPASISAGGAGTFGKYGELIKAMVKEKTFSPEIMRQLPDDVASQIGKLWGFERKSGKKLPFATKIENLSRSASFMALKDQGLSDADALKTVNKWLFDYGTKRWEQPIKSILPFWAWQKNLAKLAVTMPFANPRVAKGYTTTYDQLYTKPQSQIEDREVEYTDEATGRQVKYNLRDKYKGKIKIGNTWVKTPFNALTPDQLGEIGINPLLSFLQDYLTSTDKFGRPNTDRPAWQIGAGKFPQFNLANDFLKRNDPNTLSWFSKSGYGKSAQGSDPNASNYRQSLDNNRKFGKTALSFLGVPSSINQDLQEEEKRSRYNKFNTDFFNIDWDKRLQDYLLQDKATAYDRLQADKETLAKQYGFDFNQDISKGEWSKFDTSTARNTKELKEKARAFNDSYWNEYNAVPKADIYERSKKRPFWIKKYGEWQKDSTFKQNPYYTLPYFKNADGSKNYVKPAELKARENELDQKAYARSVKKAFWDQYWASDKATRKQLIANNPQYGKTFATKPKSEKQLAFEFWQRYYAESSPEKRKELIIANPQYNKSVAPTTKEGWQALKSSNKRELRAKARSIKGFSDIESQLLNTAKTKAFIFTNKRSTRKVVFKI